MVINLEGVPAEERRQRIAATVEERGFVHVGDLAEAFGISRVTVRADLDSLEKQGQLRRVRGGALATHRTGGMPASRAGGSVESSFEEAMSAAGAEKTAIGRHAARLISPGESVILDAGTTTMAVARALVERADLRDVVVITNGISIALELERAIPRFTVIVTGGTLRPLQHSLVNPLGAEILGRINADTVFLGCNGVHPRRGFTNLNLPEAELKQAMLRSSARSVVVADGSKVGRVELAPICSIDQADLLITGASGDKQTIQDCRDAGLEVDVPEGPGQA
ncbi:DeoR/GlpR family DNA-binding transcription regulator [Streptomyces radicis]|uniref:DeoR/GlpR transcriptional regulator n=1 Tax=Streptomyces radicis TaxID=1750517 RepID=A0A3A9W1A3_9ACTN|nr:DeoR/GlpR family DNA-binding transcription regulator [Streptomyces radicis]RKN07005.1 DeoR/GlpR transcriptional regulator [Streptomyces radicis]RKN15855.1 DeoR/GlpR transcriptional regulator [Streptomyces radicis]